MTEARRVNKWCMNVSIPGHDAVSYPPALSPPWKLLPFPADGWWLNLFFGWVFVCLFFPPLILESALFACTMHWKSLSKSEIIQLCIASASCTRMALKWHMLAVVAHFRLCLCMQSPPLSTPSAALPADQQPLLLCKALVLALLCSIHTWQSPVGPRL